MSFFPHYRPRRLRRTPALRALMRESTLRAGQLIQPLFVVAGRNVRRPIESMPGVFQLSVEEAGREAESLASAGVGGVLLFGVPRTKDAVGTSAWQEDGPVQDAARALKRNTPGLVVVTDVCLCEYTDHGHCGVLRDGDVDNDATLPLLARTAVSHAQAGADIVAPSDMMDGRVGAIRAELDAGGFAQTAIMSYAVKHASSFYGPFREAAESAPKHGDRKSYQMDHANSREALREARLDVDEGADILLVKPATLCLDLIARVSEDTDYPVAAYQVSGEFAMIRAAAERGWLNGDDAMMESLHAIRRAGADIIVTYFAQAAAARLRRDA
jgi:porphobilinogen synthase